MYKDLDAKGIHPEDPKRPVDEKTKEKAQERKQLAEVPPEARQELPPREPYREERLPGQAEKLGDSSDAKKAS